jgi:copper oxidase (laccase) domain-containing protein
MQNYTLQIGVSTRSDGTMLDRTKENRHDAETVKNRQDFCQKIAISYTACVYQIISYDPGTSFDTIVEVSAPSIEGIFADVLYTETPGVGLFLPIADCVGTVLYDPVRHALALAHIGRHASIAKTMRKTIEYLTAHGSDARNIKIWMAPSVDKEDYIMDYFDQLDDPDWDGFAVAKTDRIHLDLKGFNKNLAIKAGVQSENIEISPVNTARDKNYFSHSQGDLNGRFAVVAMMK